MVATPSHVNSPSFGIAEIWYNNRIGFVHGQVPLNGSPIKIANWLYSFSTFHSNMPHDQGRKNIEYGREGGGGLGLGLGPDNSYREQLRKIHQL